MAERLERGFVTDYPDRAPPKSTAGFKWPDRQATDEQRMAFRKTFANLIRGKGTNHREFARMFYGETRNGQGYVMPRNPGTIRKYLDGDSFPEETTARLLGAFFKTPLERFITDDGKPFEPLALIRPLKATAARRKSANGHGHKGNGAAGPSVVSPGAPALAASEPAPLPKPPKGSKPVQVEIKTLPNEPNWCHVVISGTVPLDVGLGLMAFIERATHKVAPMRK